MRKAIIIGAGTQGQILCSYLREQDINVVGFIDDNVELIGKELLDLPVLGNFRDLYKEEFRNKIDDVYCPIGINRIRVSYLSALKSLGYGIPSYFHPSVIISPDVFLGEAIYMFPGNIIMPHSSIGNYFMMNTCSTVAHHTTIEEGVFLSSGVNIGAMIHVRRYAFVGMGVTAMTGINEIGKDALIGAGAVVIRDVPDNAVIAGNPGKILRYKDPVEDPSSLGLEH